MPETSLTHKYCVDRKVLLGSGSFGKVYKGYRSDNHFAVVIKCISRVGRWGQINGHRVPLEVEMMNTCRNIDGVVNMVDFGFDAASSQWIVITESQVNVVTLHNYISRMYPIADDTAREIVSQVVAIIVKIHQTQICHGDIKDDNILIDPQSRQITLIDFGAASRFDAEGNVFDGAELCSPPELLTNQPFQERPAEAWTIGILAFTLFCGRMPFYSVDDITVGRLKWTRKPTVDCCNFICRCLAMDPNKRMRVPVMLEHPWLRARTCKEVGSCDSGIFVESTVEEPSNPEKAQNAERVHTGVHFELD